MFIHRKCNPGELRHLGLENPLATKFTQNTDVNGITWEHNAQHQADEINGIWPQSEFKAIYLIIRKCLKQFFLIACAIHKSK